MGKKQNSSKMSYKQKFSALDLAATAVSLEAKLKGKRYILAYPDWLTSMILISGTISLNLEQRKINSYYLLKSGLEFT